MKRSTSTFPKEVDLFSKLLKYYGAIPQKIWLARGGYEDGGDHYRFDFPDHAVLILNIKNKKVVSIGFDYGNSRKYSRIGSMLKLYESKKDWRWGRNIRIAIGNLSEDKRLPRSMFSFVLAIHDFCKLTKKRVGIIATR